MVDVGTWSRVDDLTQTNLEQLLEAALGLDMVATGV